MNAARIPRFSPHLLSALFTLGAVFWMRQSVDWIGWSLVELLFAGWLAYLLFTREEIVLPADRILAAILSLVLWSAASLGWSVNLHATLTAAYKAILILIAIVVFANDAQAWERAMARTAKAISLFAALLLIPPVWNGYGLTHSGLFAALLVLGGLLALHDLLSFPASRRLKFPILLAILLILFRTASLGSILAFLCGAALLLSRYRLRKGPLAIGLAVLTVLLLIPVLRVEHLDRRISLLEEVVMRKREDRFASERLQIWRDGLLYFSSHPWIGTGTGTFRDVYPQFKSIEGARNAPYAHNEPLNLLCELGIVGGALSLWFFISCLGLLRQRREGREAGPWPALLTAACVQSFFDFNLRYPPTLILSLFALSRIISPASCNRKLARAVRWGGALFLLLFAAAASLPGIADALFRRAWDRPEKRREAAVTALRLDPLNALYHFESGRPYDLLIAIELEPRNVWYRRQAALLSLQEWRRSGRGELLAFCRAQYAAILALAPNVTQFRREAEELSRPAPAGK